MIAHTFLLTTLEASFRSPHGSSVLQTVAAYVLNAAWQAPLIAMAAWTAIRIGRPAPKLAYRIWALTIALCVLTPLGRIAAANTGGTAGSLANQQSLPAVAPAPAPMFPTAEASGNHVVPGRANTSAFTPESWSGDVVPLSFSTWQLQSLAFVYVLLTFVAAARTLGSILAGRRLVRHAQPITEGVFVQRFHVQCRAFGIAPTQVLISAEVQGPMLAGLLRPALLLPETYGSLSEQECIAVAAHEAAHLARNDPRWHALVEALSLPMRLHPAVCWLQRRARQAREMACDHDAAKYLGSTTVYARALLSVAERMRSSQSADAMAMGMFYTEGDMEERVRSVVMETRPGTWQTRAARLTACTAVALTAAVCLAAVQVQPSVKAQDAAAQQAGKEPAGVQSSSDPTQADIAPTVPKHSAMLSQAERARMQEQMRASEAELRRAEKNIHSVETQRQLAKARAEMLKAQKQLQSGEIEQQLQQAQKQLQSGELERQLQQVQKQMSKAQLQLQSDALRKAQQQLQSGELERQLQKAEKQIADAQLKLQSGALRRAQEQAERALNTPEMKRRIAEAEQEAKLSSPMPEAFAGANSADPYVQLDAHTMATMLDLSKLPKYPEGAKQNKIGGTVTLAISTDPDGNVVATDVVSSPDPQLSQAAMDAVRRWKYKPYVKDGRPVPVHSTVDVSFTPGS